MEFDQRDKKHVPELTATQQAEYESKHRRDSAYDSRLSLNGVNIVTDEYFDDSPAMYRPPPPEEFSSEFLKEIEKTTELLRSLRKAAV